MNWDRLEGQWKQQRGKAVYRWGKTMNDELSALFGKYEVLVGKLQEKYGIAKDEEKHRAEEFKIIVEQFKHVNSKLVKPNRTSSIKKKSGKRTVKLKASPKKRN